MDSVTATWASEERHHAHNKAAMEPRKSLEERVFIGEGIDLLNPWIPKLGTGLHGDHFRGSSPPSRALAGLFRPGHAERSIGLPMASA